MAASAPGAPLKVRIRLEATWTDDGTPDGSIDEDIRWVTTLDGDFEWEECKRLQPVERGSIQLMYLPATRDAARFVTRFVIFGANLVINSSSPFTLFLSREGKIKSNEVWSNRA